MSFTVGANERRPHVESELTKRQLSIIVAHTALAILLAVAAVLLLRRLSGGFRNPLSAATIVVVAAFLELAAFGIRRVFESPLLFGSVLGTEYLVLTTQYFLVSTRLSRFFRWMPAQLRLSFADIATTAAVLAIAIALSIAGTSPVGLIFAWLIIIGGEIGQHFPPFHFSPRKLPPQQTPISPLPHASAPTDEIAEPEIPAGLVQQLTRVVEDGRESIHGLLKAHIDANDSQAVVHIAFCPPLAERPELSANALDCDDVQIRLTQVESFGARLEARLARPTDQPRSLIVEILGSAKANLCS